ncbi:class I SAM-dependent methyltransferase [Dactylosporangium darangshiense]|uniref:Methyltransferase type 11 domain-containing protein n=1 Tax=Dactylosporangium darangshiense TaxID=579108 RepID=A0ABP8CUE4_9ACTN
MKGGIDMARSRTLERHLSDDGYGLMIRALNELHYAGETSFYSTASLRPCEKHLFDRYGHDARILDVGCGAGRVTKAITERGGRITGVDINPTAIDVARQTCQDADFVCASMTDLPLPDASFDQVWCLRFSFNALPTVVERINTLAELWRVCAPGGSMFVEVFNWHHRGRFGLVRIANLLDQYARVLRWHGEGKQRSAPIPARDILYLANKAEGAAPGFAHLTTVREMQQLGAAAKLDRYATVISEESLLAGTRTPIRPRHSGYSMWLAATKPGGLS